MGPGAYGIGSAMTRCACGSIPIRRMHGGFPVTVSSIWCATGIARILRSPMPRRPTVAEGRVARHPLSPGCLPDLSWTMLVVATISGPIAGAVIGLLGIVIGLWINGDRAERQRRRDLHARALNAVLAYAEMPFMIRRRRHEAEERSAERVRLSTHFSEVKAEIATCQVLLAADGDQRVTGAYDTLVETARRTAGAEAHHAWNDDPIQTDAQMNMAALFDRLKPLRDGLHTFEGDLARATLPRRQRAWRWMRGVDV